MEAIAGARVGKYNLGTRAGKCKVSFRVGKRKSGARVCKYKLGARAKVYWRRGVVVITTAQLHSTKLKPRLWAGSNPARGVSEIHDGEDL